MTTPQITGKILIVDDEKPIQELLTLGLSGTPWHLLTTDSGEEALRLIASEKPSGVLLDIGLPKMSGLEILKQIRSFSSIPVIMLTVENDDAIKIEALENGADDFVNKPFSMPVLKARIHAVLRRFQARTESQEVTKIFQSRHLRVEFDSHKVFVCEKETHLTATEFELLEMFIQTAGRVLTHQAIIDKVWGDKVGDQMHYLRVYINNLRRKIELNPSIPKLIVTEPGIGYRFES